LTLDDLVSQKRLLQAIRGQPEVCPLHSQVGSSSTLKPPIHVNAGEGRSIPMTYINTSCAQIPETWKATSLWNTKPTALGCVEQWPSCCTRVSDLSPLGFHFTRQIDCPANAHKEQHEARPSAENTENPAECRKRAISFILVCHIPGEAVLGELARQNLRDAVLHDFERLSL